MEDHKDWYSEDAATFGDRVAAAREQAGMTQKQLSKRLGVRLSTLRAWEDDLSEPRANRLSMLAGILNVSMTWLITGEGDGVEGPAEPTPMSDTVRDMMIEMRDLRADLLRRAAQVGRLEKRLRAALDEPVDG